MRIRRISKIKLNVNNIFWVLIFFMVALPLHASNKILSYLSLTSTVSIFHLFFFLLLVYVLLKEVYHKKVHFNVYWILIVIYFILLIDATRKGISEGYGISMVLGDAVMYYLPFCIIFIYLSPYVKKKTIYETLAFFSSAEIISCTFSLVMFLTRDFSFWGLYSYNGGRYFGGYVTLCGILVPFLVYEIINNKHLNLYNVYGIIAMLICVMLAQSRSVFIIIAVGTLLVVLSPSKSMSKRSFLLHIIGIFFLALALYFLLNSSLDIINRLLNTNLNNKNETTFARVYLYRYYFPRIIDNKLGVGFGRLMYFVNEDMSTQRLTGAFTIDSAILTVGYKGGLLLMLLYIAFYCIPIFCLLNKFIKFHDLFYLSIDLIYIALIFSMTIISAQAIHTYAVLTFICVFICSTLLDRNKPYQHLETRI